MSIEIRDRINTPDSPPIVIESDDKRAPREPMTQLIWRFRLAAICAVLSMLTFVQDPGRIAADTKLDLSVNPAGLLARSLHLWDPQGFSGQLQNQAYGYLWPMGPFFWAGHTLGFPGWVVQRLWWSTLLCLAFLGVVKLARLLGLGGPFSRVVGGLAFALAPMMLTKLGTISSEALPIALAPWVLIPLVCGAQRGSARRWAALSALVVLCVGGVNAVATVAVLPLGAWWILTRTRGRRRWSLGSWWVLGVFLATLWWAIPLVILGKYSPPFLDWIESSSVTTSITNAPAVLRGSTDWIGYLADNGGPVWPAGWSLATESVLIVATGMVALFGIAGLARRDMPHRVFLLPAVLTGVALVSMGHVEAISGLGSADLQTLLDGVLAPLRNVHKFDVVLRLPLALGLVWFVDRLPSPQWLSLISKRRRGLAQALVVVTCGCIALSALPIVNGELSRARSFGEIPDYWYRASDYLAHNGGNGRALVLPGAPFAEFVWGRTQDEPLQATGSNAWDVRDAVPLSNAGHTRLLDAIQQQTDGGVGSPGLATVLQRSGFRWLVIRNDIDPNRTATPKLSVLHEALARSPGITKVQEFGSALSTYSDSSDVDSADNVEGTYSPVELYRVGPADASTSPVTMRDATSPIELVGATEGLLPLADSGLLGDRTVVVAADPGVAGLTNTQSIATDTWRRREVSFGATRDKVSQTLTASDPWTLDRAVHDYLTPGTLPTSIAEYSGIKSVTASSSGSDIDAGWVRDPAHQPFSALDGDSSTAWVTGRIGSGVGQSWRVAFDHARTIPAVTLSLAAGSQTSMPTMLNIITDSGRHSVSVKATNDPQTVAVGGAATQSLRIQLAAVDDTHPDSGFGLREVSIPGVSANKAVRVDSTGPVTGAVLSAAPGERSGCVFVSGQYQCVDGLGRPGEEQAGIDRWVWLAAGNYRLSSNVQPRPGPGFDRYLPTATGIVAAASSQFVPNPAAAPQSAVDGQRNTAWVAAVDDHHPSITLTLARPTQITSLRIVVPNRMAISSPLGLRVTAGGRTTDSFIGVSGRVVIPKVTTKTVKIEVRQVNPRRQIAFGGDSQQLPVGIAEIQLEGGTDIRDDIPSGRSVDIPCGKGPGVSVDGVAPMSTSAHLTSTEALAEMQTTSGSCGKATVALTQGWHHIVAKPSESMLVNQVDVLPANGVVPGADSGTATVRTWDSNNRSVDVAATRKPRTLEVNEAFNSGWQATLNGQSLSAVQVDGWRQAWIVPAGAAGTITMTYGPDGGYRLGLLVGLLAVLALVGIALVRPRRSPLPPIVGRSGRWLVPITGGIAILIAFGVWGLVAGAAAWAIAVVGKSRMARPGPAIAIGLGLVAIGLAAAWTWPDLLHQPTWVGALEALSISAMLGFVLGLFELSRFERAIPGRSIKTHDSQASGIVTNTVNGNSQ